MLNPSRLSLPYVKLKYLVALLSAQAAIAGVLQTTQLPASDSPNTVPLEITLASGEMLQIHYTADDLQIDIARNQETGFSAGFLTFSHTPTKPNPLISGPARIRIKGAVIANNGMNLSALFTHERRSSDPSPTQYVPHSAVVIPANAAGTFDVTLEKSTDLVSWTSVSPGAFPSGTSGAFFRVRIVMR